MYVPTYLLCNINQDHRTGVINAKKLIKPRQIIVVVVVYLLTQLWVMILFLCLTLLILILPDHLFLHAIYNEVIVSSVEMVTQTI